MPRFRAGGDPPAEIRDRLAYTGRWAAFRECLADVDRERWTVLLSRALAQIPRTAERAYTRTLIAGMHQMFVARRLPGAWEEIR